MLVWKTVADETVCSACAALDGKVDGDSWSSLNGPTWGIDAATGRWVQLEKAVEWMEGTPPLHPHCRCTLEERGL